jgi:hypothetical protein
MNHLKYIVILLLVILSVSCKKKSAPQPKCGTGVCTEIFASIGIQFNDKQGFGVIVKDFSATNLRTNQQIHGSLQKVLLAKGYQIIADDSNKDEVSDNGDDVLVSGTDTLTNQIKTAVVKISGGCRCHVEKLSGPDKIVFD